MAGKEVLFTFTPDVLQMEDSSHIREFTTGAYGVYLLSRILSPSHVGVTGFTMFLKNTARRYWKSETPNGLHAHDVEREAEIFVGIFNEIPCKVEVTEDII